MSQLKDTEHLKISFKEIEIGTKNFGDCIGKGGYGMVYKGELIISGKPTMVAVKRLNKQFGQGLKEFLTEIQLLSGQKHPNLISLLGYCDEGEEKIIVYEYAERGSLDKYLWRSNTTHTLSWLDRLMICVYAARGLDFLHNHFGKHLTIIHRDIKSANILIDENWVAKVSDLGLSKLSLAGLNRSEVVSQACGTLGYCEPEYFETSIVKKESDVYSFGMVLFEVLCGRLCNIEDDDGFLLSCPLVKDYYEKKKLDDIVDPSLNTEMSLDSKNKFSAIAYRCLHDDRGQRPPMGLVVEELEESLKIQYCYLTTNGGKEPEWISSNKSQSSSSKSYSKAESQSSSSNYSERNSHNSSSKSYSRMELREALEALLVATNSDDKYNSQEQISSDLDDFNLPDKFIDGEKRLTCDGLLQNYDDGDEVMKLELTRKIDDQVAFGPRNRRWRKFGVVRVNLFLLMVLICVWVIQYFLDLQPDYFLVSLQPECCEWLCKSEGCKMFVAILVLWSLFVTVCSTFC